MAEQADFSQVCGRLRPVVVASATGVRAGELHALRWRHVDLSRAKLTVETRVDVYRDEDVTKTAAGMRTIPLGAAVVAALSEWRQRSAHPKADDLVFPNRCGDYEGHDNMVKRRFLPLFRKLTEWHAKDPVSRPLPPALQLARAAPLRGLVLDRGGLESEDGSGLCRAYEPVGDDGPVWTPVQK